MTRSTQEPQSSDSNPLDALTEHGQTKLNQMSLAGDIDLHEQLALFFAHAKNGDMPVAMKRQLGTMLKDANEAVENGEEPSFGSTANTVPQLDQKYKPLMLRMLRGELEVDLNGNPVVADQSNSMFVDLCKRLEELLGIKQVVMGDDEARFQVILSEIDKLKSTKAIGGDADTKVMELVDIIAEAIGTSRKDRETDQAYAERVAATVGSNKQFLDNTEAHLRQETSLEPNKNEPQHNFIARMIDSLAEPSEGERTGWFRNRGKSS